MLLTGARVVTPEGVLDPGWVEVHDGVIVAVGEGQPPLTAGPATNLGGSWLLPGFIDLHVHGGGGHDVTSSPADLAAAVAFHRRHGTTRTLVSLVAAPVDELERQLGWVADLVAEGADPGVLGAHLEGPFLSQLRCGAQPAEHLLLPDLSVFDKLLAASRSTLRTMTIAPELPGALPLIRAAVAAGVVVAVGHTDATYDETRAAVDAGARLFTHLFNGMTPMHHREPGTVGAALASSIACEVINDGVHVHPALLGLVASVPGRAVLVTDAISAAGLPDGSYVLGGQAVQVSGGEPRLGDGTLAGSTLTMDAALRRAVRPGGLSVAQASAAASTNPARVLGIEAQCGAIAVGLAADLVTLDDELDLVRVMASGVWAH